ncbi:MAG: peptidylprolyl isomerase [Phycisphaerales bacterium]|nr:peptidylprolyl isomerase [Phycisphaerales bacterium]
MSLIQNATRRCRSLVASSLLLSLTAGAAAQLQPERLYYGKDRQVPVAVEIPGDLEGEARVHIFDAAARFGDNNEHEPVMTASVAAGRVDFASLFPDLWETESPELHYAQLVVGDTKIGPPLVLQPLLTPVYAVPGPGGQPQFRPMPQTYSGLRIYTEKHAVFETTEGEIKFRMRPDQAPNTVNNFRHLIEGGFYTDIVFHRVIGERDGRPGFVIQVGDPTGTGTGGPGYFIDLEQSELPHDFGVLSMARSSDPNSNGSQVFVCLSRDSTRMLDGLYTSFAEAVSGGDVIRRIGAVRVGAQDRPVDPPRIVRARLVDAPPFGEGDGPLSAEEQAPTER